jgi:hypothetical protein
MGQNISHGLYLGYNAKPWQGVETDSSTQQHPLGAYFDDQYGNRFRYCLNGASALVAGDLVQGPIKGGATTTEQTVAIIGAQTAAGNVKIPVAALTTTQTAGVFDEGWAAFEDTSAVATYTRRFTRHGLMLTWKSTRLYPFSSKPQTLLR